ncbi:hypothetical protein BpHYR1_025005 [Brachionus plicatilis]|uniref:Uncharacterized protein n=1 Tax=Brachionus plicatilis TaxID=10195 RepID=A0A3M7RZ37_BRAPC|nr:hypothetical protein BpHYR1_025005 [Brachionus plicatilis]
MAFYWQKLRVTKPGEFEGHLFEKIKKIFFFKLDLFLDSVYFHTFYGIGQKVRYSGLVSFNDHLFLKFDKQSNKYNKLKIKLFLIRLIKKIFDRQENKK